MARFKEPQYFAPHKTREGFLWGEGNPNPEPGIDWYLRLFKDSGDVQYAGESSVSYTARPSHTGCEERIYRFNPDARLIYIMRDPLERAISHYWHFVAYGREDRDMLTAFRREPEYIGRSNYAMQLEPYLETFGEEKLFLLTLEELNADPDEVFRRLFAWLGVDTDVEIDIGQKFNVSGSDTRQTRRGLVCLDTFRRHWRWRRIESKLPVWSRWVLDRIVYKRVCRRDVDITPAVRYLRPILEVHTARLCAMTGRDFGEWKTLYRNGSEGAESGRPLQESTRA